MDYKDCTLCERKCHINRYEKKGVCGADNKLKVARAALHYWEEPCISGSSGSGTIFFSNCNLKCLFCQNKKISTNGFGKEITINRLSDICIGLQKQGANNINLVTPTHYIPQIRKAIIKAKKMGLNNVKVDPKDMAHIEAIILSMTPYERRHPEVLKASRKLRISKGCGRDVNEINRLLKQFEEMKKMMKMMSSGKMKMPF